LSAQNHDVPAKHAFQQSFLEAMTAGQTQGTHTFTVPLGQRLVVEQLSVTGAVDPGQVVVAGLSVKVNNIYGSYGIEMTPQGNFPGQGDRFTGSHRVRLYADPGTQVNLVVIRNGGSGGARFEISLSGYLIDFP
jgi:hypothetical protein